ncbi:MAG: glycoside hydrolase family 97 N-terminal domain-containing protein, partial [Bacteroidota bacterium]|nr:glycoside hydrolase family 97 N-terminal domain-containing protein [Bacteroidota bacterium]
MKNISLIILILIFINCSLFSQTGNYRIASPDNKLTMEVTRDQNNGALTYQVEYENQPVVLSSQLGITCNNEKWTNNLVIKKTEVRSQDTVWKPIYGERATIRDHFNETAFIISKEGNPERELKLIVRAYNEGIAFRYAFTEGVNGGSYLHITGESTEFTFQEQTKAWFTPRAQTPYKLLPLKDWPDESDRPLTLELPNGLFACLGEAEMVNYARTKFKLSPDKPNTIVGSMYDDVDEIAPFNSPWRMIMVAKTAGELLQNNFLILNLNPPCALQNTSWIKPGKIMREVTLTTDGAKSLVDFAVAHHLQYIHFDAGWYGRENLISSDATKVDARRNLDLKE